MVIVEAGAEVVATELPAIRADALQLRQLFQNLIENAVKYRDRSRPCQVRLSAEISERNNSWLVSVADNGIGFDPELADQIFLPFSRLQPKSVSGGTGLGLTICGRIVERHGWSIRANSTPGQGSTFTIEIPAAT